MGRKGFPLVAREMGWVHRSERRGFGIGGQKGSKINGVQSRNLQEKSCSPERKTATGLGATRRKSGWEKRQKSSKLSVFGEGCGKKGIARNARFVFWTEGEQCALHEGKWLG